MGRVQPSLVPKQRPSRLFISHAAADKELARLVANHLQRALPAAGIFLASRPGDIPAGEPWLEVIRQQLMVADAYVVLLTPTSIRRQWIWFESGAAWFSGRRVVPVVYGMVKDDVHPPLSAHQTLDLGDEEDRKQIWVEFGTELQDPDTLRNALRDLGPLPVQDGLIDASATE
jgi:hypothetical protein